MIKDSFEKAAGPNFQFISSEPFDLDRRLEVVYRDPSGKRRSIAVNLDGAAHEVAAVDIGQAAADLWMCRPGAPRVPS